VHHHGGAAPIPLGVRRQAAYKGGWVEIRVRTLRTLPVGHARTHPPATPPQDTACDVGRAARARPWIPAVALLVTLLLAGVSAMGVLLAARAEGEHRAAAANGGRAGRAAARVLDCFG
jgi:hypothetical protein